MSGGSTKRSKRDGTGLRSKREIIEDYDQSNLPYPLKPLWKLDYCYRLTYTMYKHSFVLSLPLTMVYYIWNNSPQCWAHSLKSFPYLKVLQVYLTCMFVLNAGNAVWSVATEDYWYFFRIIYYFSNRASPIYDLRRNAYSVRQLIQNENLKHSTTIDG